MPAMTIANMMSHGVRSVIAQCACGHQAKADVSGLDPAIEIPSLVNRLRCSECGKRPRWVMPDWTEHRPAGVPKG